MARPRVRFANYCTVAPGTVWGPRRIADHELVLVVAGAFAYRDERQESGALGPGDLLCIPPGITHRLEECAPHGGSAFSCVHFGLRDAQGVEVAVAPRLVTPAKDLEPHFKRLAGYFRGPPPFGGALADAVCLEIWLLLRQAWQGVARPALSPHLAALRAHIAAHLHEPLDRRVLARVCGLTPSYVNNLFKRETGHSTGAYIRRQRMQEAHRLLMEERVGVAEAGRRVGYADQFHFSKAFKALSGYPPSSIRRGRRDPAGEG